MNQTVVDNNSEARSHTQMETTYPTINAEIQSNTYAPIIIYLQIHDRPDDILIINRITPKVFRASFYNNTVGGKFYKNLSGHDELIQYLNTFLMLQTADCEPCDYIQIDVPCLPTILIKPTHSDLNNYFKHILIVIENMTKNYDSWPKQTRLIKNNK